MQVIDAAFNRSRVVMLAFAVLLTAGAFSCISIPKESEPDIPIPTFYVSMSHEGISPEDAERLLIRPMEKELQSLEGLKEMRSIAGEGHASVTMEFHAGFDADQALLDIREKVDLVRPEFPPETEEPRIIEVNVALFPVLSVALSGAVPERALVKIARDLQDKLEALPGVLEADIGGDREEMMEIVVDPTLMESYNITFADINTLLENNNQLIAAGALDTGVGRMVVKVPGVIEDISDVMSLPIKIVGDNVVTFKDVVSIRRTFKDSESFARLKGEKAVVLEVTKRIGANIIATIEEVRAIVIEEQKKWPASVQVTFMQDKSLNIRDMLGDLQNNVITAVVLVMIVVIAVLGVRPALLVGMAIPGSFLTGILAINTMGLTLNIVVLFSLILVVGMLVDGAIVTIELADRKIAEGLERKEAYAFAAKRMTWPIIASTATTLVVFLPLLFWPGLIGEFMKYMPITVVCTLVASLFMALIFIPVLGGLIGSKSVGDKGSLESIRAAEAGDLNSIKGLTGSYLRFLENLLHHPVKVLVATLFFMVLVFLIFINFGKGTEFFPDTEPEFIQVQVQARGDLSIYEKDALVQRIEDKLLDMDVFKAIYSRTLDNTENQQDMPEDVIGVLQLEFIHWRNRDPASEIIPKVRTRLRDVAGIKVQVRKEENGPTAGKPVEIEIRSISAEKLTKGVEYLTKLMREVGGFVDVEDDRPLPGIEWRIEIDREQAAKFGADVSTLGNAVQMLTTGLKVAEYQPDDADEELDIRLRFDAKDRHLERLTQLRIPTTVGHIPIGNFISFDTAQKTGNINRVDGRRVMTIKGDVEEGLLVDQQVQLLKDAVAKSTVDPDISIHFKGEDFDQQEASSFLSKAFLIAIFMMTMILVTQFNSFYQAGLVLSAIIFSTSGVLLGLLITGNPFGIVMCGIGVIALAGIVVNNNIILIDTYNEIKAQNIPAMEAILRTAAQRMRPVLLTSGTTILGLIPMVFAMTIDFVNQDIAFGAPSTQWWIQLSSAIAGGLAFATVLTLILTPCLLILGETFSLKKAIQAFALSIITKTLLKIMHYIPMLCIALTLSACSASQSTRPVLHADIPQSWVSEKTKSTPYQHNNWIAAFGDETLVSLVNEALANNNDLQTTVAALDRANAEAKQAGADFAPVIDLNTSAERSDYGQSGGIGLGGSSLSNDFGVSLNVSWEADVWGRIRAGDSAAEYEYYAAEYDLEAAKQSIAGQTAKAYFMALESTKQLELANGFEANLQKNLDVTEAFQNEGLSSKRDTYVIKADLARAKERVQNAQSSKLHALRSLEVLLGRYPAADIATGVAFPSLPHPVSAGIPSDVLERRPDIRAAERRVAAAFYRIEGAKAAKLPSITLTGSFGKNSDALNTLTDPASLIWNVAGSLLFPVFNAGKLDTAIDIETAEQKNAIANYQQTTLDTFFEVETALSNEQLYRTRQNNLDDAHTNAKSSEDIADENFKIGEIDLLDLLQIKGITITTNIDRIRSQRELLEQRVDLHLALGGDIKPSNINPRPPITQ